MKESTESRGQRLGFMVVMIGVVYGSLLRSWYDVRKGEWLKVGRSSEGRG